MKNVTLYHHGPSTCSQKVRMILELKNISYESKIIDLLAGEQHEDEYVKLNPNHLVPTLVTDDGVIIESTVINEYLDDGAPSHSIVFVPKFKQYEEYNDTISTGHN